jgi:PAS domain S-box-containing protein
VGLDATQTSRDLAFCGHAILQPQEVMLVPDATRDARFAANALVTGDPNIRFYAGAPIVTSDGHAVGTVCVIDRTARQLSPTQIESLEALARIVVHLLEDRRRQILEMDAATSRQAYRLFYMQELTRQRPDLKAYIDRDYRWQFVNDAYLHYWQVDRDAVEGRLMVDVIGEDLFHNVVKPQIDVAFQGEIGRFEKVFNFPLRGPTPVEIRYSPARNESGEIVGCVAHAQDISERKQREQELHDAKAAAEANAADMQRFVHIVSHDLREPVNSIVNFTGLLRRSLQDASDTTLRHVDYVGRAGKRLVDLIDGLTRYVSLQQHAAKRELVDMNAVMRDVCEDLDVALQRSGGQIIHADLSSVIGDPVLLRLMMQNLMANALKFTRPGVPPAVEISAFVQDRVAEIIVADNGIGIPDDQLENIFNVFHRLHSRKQYDGSGLGLANCRRIASLHDGSVTVSSELGRGSRFIVRLPFTIQA